MRYYRRSSELYHHGVKGMKWGVRRYQNKDGSLTPAGKKRYAKGEGNKTGSSDPVQKGKQMADSLSTRKLSNMRNLQGSGEIESLAFLGITYLSLFAATVAYTTISAKRWERKKDQELETLKNEREFKKLSDVPKLSKRKTPTENMKEVNPDYPNMGSTMNCTFCTTAMAMREKGYDVVANKSQDGWNAEKLFNKAFNSPTVKMNKRQNASQMVSALQSQGDGAYGNLTVFWKYGGGHSVFWKNVDGKTHIYDGQNGKEYDVSNPNSSKFLNSINLRNVQYNRFDNCQPTDYALALIKKGAAK